MGTGPDCGFCGMNGESGASRPRAVQCESSQWVRGGGAALCCLPLALRGSPIDTVVGWGLWRGWSACLPSFTSSGNWLSLEEPSCQASKALCVRDSGIRETKSTVNAGGAVNTLGWENRMPVLLL